jgi:site-specific DNA recombinase
MKGKTMKAIGYIRVSTSEQASEGVSLEMQRNKIIQYCALNDLDLVETYADEGISAKDITGRPAFQAALDRLYTDVDALVFYKLDRAFRSVKDAVIVAEQVNKKHKHLHSIVEKLDTSSAIGEFFFNMIAAIGQLERRVIGERTKACMQELVKNNKKVSSRPPMGFRYEGKDAVEDEFEQAMLNELEALKHLSLRKASARLAEKGFVNREGNPYTPGTMQKLMRGVV